MRQGGNEWRSTPSLRACKGGVLPAISSRQHAPDIAGYFLVGLAARPRVRGGGDAPRPRRRRAHARRLGAGDGLGCARPGAPAPLADGAAAAYPPPLPRGAGGGPTLRRRRPTGRPPQAAPTRAHTRSVDGGHPRAGARTSGGGGQGRACPTPGLTPRRWGGGAKPAPSLPCVVRRFPAAGVGGDAAGRAPPRRSCVTAPAAATRPAVAAVTPLPPRVWPCIPYGISGLASDGGSCAWRQTDDAHAPPSRGPKPPPPQPPPPPPSPPPPLPPPLPLVALACRRESHALSSIAHRRVGGRRGGNASSGGDRRPNPPHAGVPRVVQGARLGGRE